MIAASSNKLPPLLSKSAVNSDLAKKIEICSSFTNLEENKQGVAVLLMLKGAAEQTAFKLDDSVINSNNSFKVLFNSWINYT